MFLMLIPVVNMESYLIMTESKKVYIGMGSNLGDSRRHLLEALKEIDAIPGVRVTACSSLYSTKPVGPQDQNYFINAVAELETTVEAHALLREMFKIENRHHRVRVRHWGERTLDLDVLYYGTETFCDDELKVPHPEIFNRAFVVFPLLEINPEFTHTDGKKLRDVLPSLPADDVRAMRRLSYLENRSGRAEGSGKWLTLRAWSKYRYGL